MPKFPKRLNEVLSVIADLQACFSEFSFAPCTGLGSKWVQLGLERSFALWLWWGARCAGSIGAARLVPGLEDVTAVPQAAGPEGLQCT